MAGGVTPSEAAEALAHGRVVIVPTDTVYGLAASLSARGAVDELFRLKGRDRTKPIPVLARAGSDLERVASFDDRAIRLAERFWPGPLTLVLPRAEGFDVDLGDAGSTVAVRVPNHDVALELLRLTGPLAVTSANLSGEQPLTTVAAARELFEPDVVILDGGTCDGPSSSILDLTGQPRLLREGALTESEIGAALDL